MSFVRGVGYAIRSLRRSLGLTTALLATIALGTGTHAALTGFVKGLLTRSVAIPEAADLVVVERPALDVLTKTSAFASLSLLGESRETVTVEEHAIWMTVVRASPGWWNVLRVPAASGQMGDLVISHHVWVEIFQSQPVGPGLLMTIDGRARRVAGVAPDWFDGIYFGRPVDVWMTADPKVIGDAGDATALGRIAPGWSFDDVRRNLSGQPVVRYSGVEPDVALKMARVERVLTWAAALVFLTAAANVSGFLLSRATRRGHETAARIALGASHRDLAELILADALVICLLGGALGGLVAFWFIQAFPALFFVEDAERLHFVPAVGPIVRSAGVYSALMLICALAPMLRIRHDGPLTILRRSGGTQVTASGRLRGGLVMTQLAVCCVLTVGAAFLIEGFRQSLRTARAERLGDPIVATVDANGGFGREAEGMAYFRSVEAEVRRVPDVTAAAWISTPPGGRVAEQLVRFEPPGIAMREITIDTMPFPSGREINDLELRAGRQFGGADGPGTCPVALVNDAAAARYFDGDAVGRAMQDPAGRRIDIVGVVGRRKGAAEDEPLVYFFERQALEPLTRETRHQRFRLRPMPPPAPAVAIASSVASPGYFSAVGARTLAGGVFPDTRPSEGCDTVVVNAETAHVYFHDNALGGAVIESDGHRAEIVGVVDTGPLRVTERRAAPMVFHSTLDRYVPRMTLIAGTTTATPGLIAEMERRLRGIVGGAPVQPVRTLDEQLSRTSLGPERIAKTLVATSATIALGLGLLGVYGMMADSVVQKKREIAVRLALGAQGWTIVAGVFRGGLGIAARGAAIGLAAAWLFVQALVRAAPGFGLPAAWMWVACPLILMVVVSVASILPARYALAVDPLTLTREE